MLKLTPTITQKLNPKTLQSIQILQMNSQELLEYIEELSLENPVIEHDDLAFVMSNEFRYTDKNYSRISDAFLTNHERLIENIADIKNGTSLNDFLTEQLPSSTMSSDAKLIVRYLIDCIDEKGYLSISTETISDELGIPVQVAQEYVTFLQQFDPPGVGARDLKECLSLQLKRMGETGIANQIVDNYLQDLANNHFNKISKELKVSAEEVNRAFRLIKNLNPFPGSSFSNSQTADYIIPDIFVVEQDNELVIEISDFSDPHITVSNYYKELLRTSEDKDIKHYLNEKLRQAEWVIESIKSRRATILGCCKVIIERQSDFFSEGAKALKPLSLLDIATELDIHESTVSRAMKGKYLQCRLGVFPLSFFLKQGVNTKNDTSFTYEKIKSAIRELIAAEDHSKPLSDQKIYELLSDMGMPISRRTVAKYREEMKIPASVARKQI